MRILFGIIVGFIGGFILGIALSSVIAVAGILILQEPIGIKFLTYYTAVICAVLVPIIDHKRLSKS